MLTQIETPAEAEVWADEQFSKVLNFLTGRRIFIHGSLYLVWLGAPYLALYRALEYRKGGGPMWVLHTEDVSGYLYGSPKRSPREVMASFACAWREYGALDLSGDLPVMPVSVSGPEGREALGKWSGILESMTEDPELWS